MPQSYEVLRAEAEAALRRARAALDREIGDYPTPIAGCDAQFNHLIAERRRLSGALEELRLPVAVPTPRWPAHVEARA